jgi:hypothetical protein
MTEALDMLFVHLIRACYGETPTFIQAFVELVGTVLVTLRGDKTPMAQTFQRAIRFKDSHWIMCVLFRDRSLFSTCISVDAACKSSVVNNSDSWSVSGVLRNVVGSSCDSGTSFGIRRLLADPTR